MKLTSLVCLAALTAAPAFAVDPALLQMAPDAAKALAGMQIAQGRQSPLGRYVLQHLGTPGPHPQAWMTQAGFDPRRDITEILVAATGSRGSVSGGLVLARGTFDTARLGAAIEAHGGVHTTLLGADVYTTGKAPHTWSIAFPDNTTALMGSPDDVSAALTRRAAATPASTALISQVEQLGAANDFWFLTLAPLSQFANAVPDPSVGNAFQNGAMFQAVTQASGGVHFGDNVVFSADAVTRSEKDAQSLQDVVRFLVSMIQSNKQPNAINQQISLLLNSLTLSTDANVMHLSLSIPESQMEAFLAATSSQRKAMRAPRRHAPSAPVQGN
jgi:hypothetical protein